MAFVGSALTGCAKGKPIDLTGLQAIRVEPAQVMLTVEGATAATQNFTVFGTFPDGERDITRAAEFRVLREGFGTFDGATYTSTTAFGGTGQIQAAAGGQVATADVILVLKQVVTVDPPAGSTAAPLPANPQGLFGGKVDAARAPTLVYPNDQVLLPPNLGRIEIHWLRGPAANTLFEVAFANSTTEVKAYARCTHPEGVQEDGCIWEPSGDAWKFIAETNRGADPLKIKVRATDDTGTGVGESAERAMSFSAGDLDGTLYYWAASQGSINRYDFGSGSGSAQAVLAPSRVTGANKCFGCHTVSKDGTKIATSSQGGGGGFLLYDLANGRELRNSTGTNDEVFDFGTFSPDGTKLAVVNDYDIAGDDPQLAAKVAQRKADGLVLFDTACVDPNTCGKRVSNISLGNEVASQPAWSPDGGRIAFSHLDSAALGSSHAFYHGAISFVDATATGFTGLMNWVPRADMKNRYSPSFSPDSSFIVFNESTCPPSTMAKPSPNEYCDAYIDPSATIFAVLKGSSNPVPLTRANAKGTLDDIADLANTYPRVAPFKSDLKAGDAEADKLIWVTFSSVRRYGVRVTPASGAPPAPGKDPNVQQQSVRYRGFWLWMTAIRPSELRAGKDPSFPSFALPFQDLRTSNHIGIWTERAVGDVI